MFQSATRFRRAVPGLVLLPVLGAIPRLAAAQLPVVEPDLTLGCGQCGGAAQFSAIRDVAISARGALLVADRDAPILRAFDSSGTVAWSAGTPGQGPGEYRSVVRAVLLPGGEVAVVDFTNRRITRLSPQHRVVATTTLPFAPTTAGANATGDVLVGAEGPLGAFGVVRWRGDTVARVVPPRPEVEPAAAARGASVAVAPDGTMAFLVNNEQYDIVREDAVGRRLPDLRRTVARVPYTAAEQQEIRDRAAQEVGMMNAMRQRAGATPSHPPPTTVRTLRPHALADALRYDPSGRLWVRTMRGDSTQTLFDLFAPTGAFLGTVPLPGHIEAFALGGRYLATVAMDDAGVPRVTRWIVR